MTRIVLLAALALPFAFTGVARAAAPQSWYWSIERAASVVEVTDQPAGCSSALYHSGVIENCVSVNYIYGGADCVGTGPRTISSTDDVYLYKTFKCVVATNTWTISGLQTAYQQMAEIVCAKQLNTSTYDACLQSALKNRIATASRSGGLGGSGFRIGAAATSGKGTVRVQVTGRFTAVVTWLGRAWKMTIQPTG